MLKKQPPKIKTSLAIDEDGRIAFLYIGHLPEAAEWVSLDVDQGEICIGGENGLIGGLIMDKANKNIYDEIKQADTIFLIGLNDETERKPIETYKVPLMVSTQL